MVKLPKYLIFLFKRFDFINNRKINKFIEYPIKLKLTDKFEANVSYELSSMVIHAGGLGGGHYVSVGKKIDKWILFNDSNTKKIKKSIALDKKAYILFYKRISN